MKLGDFVEVTTPTGGTFTGEVVREPYLSQYVVMGRAEPLLLLDVADANGTRITVKQSDVREQAA